MYGTYYKTTTKVLDWVEELNKKKSKKISKVKERKIGFTKQKSKRNKKIK